jgi:hypothetical protein
MDARLGVLRRAGRAHRPDRRALGHGGALLDADRAEVDERDRVAARGLDRDAPTMGGQRPGERDGSAGRSAHRAPVGSRDVDPAVLTAGVRVGADRERAQHSAVGGPCPRRGRRAEDERGERRHADNKETVHGDTSWFSARATRVSEG